MSKKKRLRTRNHHGKILQKHSQRIKLVDCAWDNSTHWRAVLASHLQQTSRASLNNGVVGKEEDIPFDTWWGASKQEIEPTQFIVRSNQGVPAVSAHKADVPFPPLQKTGQGCRPPNLSLYLQSPSLRDSAN